MLLRALILFADRYTLPPYIPDRIPALIATVAFILLFHGVVFAWQVVGVLRATQHQSSILAKICTVVTFGVIGPCLALTVYSSETQTPPANRPGVFAVKSVRNQMISS